MRPPKNDQTIDVPSSSTSLDLLQSQYDAAWQLALRTGGPAPNRESFVVDAGTAGAERESFLTALSLIDDKYARLRDSVVSNGATMTISPGSPLAGTDQAPALDDPQYADTLDPKPGQGAKPREPRLLAAGVAVGNYELLGVIAHGGMGVVYKARHTRLDRHAAIKMILAGAHASEDHFARFEAESQVVARLQHPNIVQLYEVGEHDDLPYIALEFVEGGSLAHKAGGQPQPPREAAGVVELLARGMDYAHQKNVIHRDLKPANVLLTPTGVPKITDFGLAKQLESDSGQTRSGTLMGTPSYMAPEQAAGWNHCIGPHTDVYALGAILYELLTGTPPFSGANPLETVVAVLKDDPVPPTRLQPKVPRDLETICMKCLEKEPQKRYDTAAELADDLRRFLAQEPIRARPVGRAERLWRWCRRNPGIAGLSAAVLLLLTTVAVGSTAAAFRIQSAKRAAEENAVAAREAQELAEANATEARRAQTRAETAQAATAQALQKEEAARTEADRQKGIAQKNFTAAETARKRADEFATAAAAQRELALDALGGLTTSVQEKLEDTPATQQIKQELIELALDKLRKISGTDEQTAVADIRMAEGHRRLGDLAQRLGDVALARRNYEQVDRIVRQQLDANPGDPTWKRSLSVAQAKLGDLCAMAGDKVRATEHYEIARKHRIEIATLSQTVSAAVDLAQVYVKLGDVSPPEPAVSFYKESLRLREIVLASVKSNDPAYPNYRRDLRVSRYKLADGYLRGGDAVSALPHATKAVELAEGLARDYPRMNQLKQDVALAHAKLGDVYKAIKKPEEARKEHEAAVKVFEPLAKADTKDVVLQVTYAVLMAQSGRHAHAARLAEQLSRQAPKNAFLQYNAACALSLCAEAAAGGKPEEQKLAAGYGESALGCLKTALAAGFADDDQIRTDPELETVRKLPGYADLVKGLR